MGTIEDRSEDQIHGEEQHRNQQPVQVLIHEAIEPRLIPSSLPRHRQQPRSQRQRRDQRQRKRQPQFRWQIKDRRIEQRPERFCHEIQRGHKDKQRDIDRRDHDCVCPSRAILAEDFPQQIIKAGADQGVDAHGP